MNYSCFLSFWQVQTLISLVQLLLLRSRRIFYCCHPAATLRSSDDFFLSIIGLWIRAFLNAPHRCLRAAEAMWDVSVDDGENACPSHKRFEAERLQRGQMEKEEWSSICHLSFQWKAAGGRDSLHSNTWPSPLVKTSACATEESYIIISRHVHSLLKNTDLRAKEELRQTKAVQIL